MKKNIILALSALMMLPLTGCQRFVKEIVEHAVDGAMSKDYKDSEKWGKVVTRDLDLRDFQEISLSGAVNVEFTQDSTFSVQAYGNEKVLDAYEFAVNEGQLNAECDNSRSRGHNMPSVTLRISAPVLTQLDVSGAGDFTQKTPICQEEPLQVEVDGAGDINLDTVNIKNLDIRISGAGDVDMKHVTCAQAFKIRLSGAGDVNGHVEAQDVTLKVSGAGDGTLDVKCDRLKATCEGAGDIKLTGTCRQLEKQGDGVKASGLKVQK